MKDKFRIFLKGYEKPIAGVIIFIVIAFVILFVHNLKINQNSVEAMEARSGEAFIKEEVREGKEELQVLETLEVNKIEEAVTKDKEVKIEDVEEDKLEDKLEDETKVKSEDKIDDEIEVKSEDEAEKTTNTLKSIENPETESERIIASTPTKEVKYNPISEGWKVAKSAKGDISKAQKADLDVMIESWKEGILTDQGLRDKIISYLEEQKIEYLEVSVTSKGYALYQEVPEVDLKNGGNLYSFVGTYSTGKQNPDKTNKTVCYNWSAFVF